ncbi:hypothetical protein ABZ342_28825 [Amycolatopsis sp. NPDC005961]|uniref:hypothetical protein n=1 Tax=Amycolatopsis sp. NPDC005961 TaxID=3156720 RepID=UPI0034046C71
MLKRRFVLLTAICAVSILGTVSPATAAGRSTSDTGTSPSVARLQVAQPGSAPTKSATRSVATPVTAATTAASPVCSGTEGWGKIRYQVCVRYNCDSADCFSRGYLGLINTATSSRTVNWILYTSVAPDGTEPVLDGRGTVTLAAGKQQTIFSPTTWPSPCNIRTTEWLTVQYDSAGWSPAINVSTLMPCV